MCFSYQFFNTIIGELNYGAIDFYINFPNSLDVVYSRYIVVIYIMSESPKETSPSWFVQEMYVADNYVKSENGSHHPAEFRSYSSDISGADETDTRF